MAPNILHVGTAAPATGAHAQWGLDAGRGRIRANRERGTKREQYVNRYGLSEEIVEQRACCAEILFGLWVGIAIEQILSWLVRDTWFKEPNGFLLDGRPYNVVHRPELHYALSVPTDVYGQPEHPDTVYALVVSQWPQYEFRGWAPRHALMAIEYRAGELPHCPTVKHWKKRWDPQYAKSQSYVLEQDQLRRFGDLTWAVG